MAASTILRLPPVHMSSGMPQAPLHHTTHDKHSTVDNHHEDHRRRQYAATQDHYGAQYPMPSQHGTTALPPPSRLVYPLGTDEKSFQYADDLDSPPTRKRRRGDSDMSMASAGSRSPAQFGNVRITSTSFQAVVRDTDDASDSSHRKSVTFEDSDYESRASFTWRSSQGSGRDSMSSSLAEEDANADSAGDAARPYIQNASRNITFEMLQQHFAKPLKDAADYFGVCTTLLKKVCRRNGILSWPYRQIIGLQKSIASMEQQVQYFDGEQRRQYTNQLTKLQIKLDSFVRTGEAPSEDALTEMLRSYESTPPQATYPTSHASYHQDHGSASNSTRRNSVMASAVRLDGPDSHAFESRPLSAHRPQDYTTTGMSQPTHVGYQTMQIQRPLPSLASILNQQSQSPPTHSHSEDRYSDHQRRPNFDSWRHL